MTPMPEHLREKMRIKMEPHSDGFEDAFCTGAEWMYQEMQAEIEYLNRSLADERSGDCDLMKDLNRAKQNLEFQKAENQRLRAALKKILDAEFVEDDWTEEMIEMHDIAREALKQGGSDHE